MALTAPSTEQRRYAGILAWERGLKIAPMPETSSELSGLIQHLLLNVSPLPATDQQHSIYTKLVRECVAKVPDFDAAAFSAMPEDRADANKAINALRKRLNGVAYRNGMQNASQFLVEADSPEAQEAARAEAVASSVLGEDDDLPI